MALERKAIFSGVFVTTRLPWVVGAVAFAFYLGTLAHWVTLPSLGTVARVSGWLWQPETTQPLTFVLLAPFRCLPESWIPLSLNLFTATCAAAVLGLLARSVSLLRYDLARDKPFLKEQPAAVLSIPTAWMPPVLAAILCGLRLGFWEHATSAAGGMIDLLLLAFVIRCFLEFRMDPDQSWLSQSAFAWGLGMANHWLLIGCLPVFVGALLWLKGLSPFLERRFLMRMSLWGLAGLSLYLWLPALNSIASHGPIGFWTSLHLHLKAQKSALAWLRNPTLLFLTLTSLLPFLLVSIRWRSHTVQTADDAPLGVYLIKVTGHLVHFCFFAAALWLALDPAITPHRVGWGTLMPFFDYAYALAGGYCGGYFLLFGATRGASLVSRMTGGMVRVLVFLLLLALLAKNFGELRLTNGPLLREFARQLYADLPAGRSVVLSEDSNQLLLLRAELAARHYEKDALLLETRSLASTRYQRFVAEKFKSRWPFAPPDEPGLAGPGEQQDLVAAFAAREQMVYLHPSSGLFLERFIAQPNGCVQLLVPLREKPGEMDAATLPVPALNEALWQNRWTHGLKLLAECAKPKPRVPASPARCLLDALLLTSEKNHTASFLGGVYSKALDSWGARLQRAGQWPEAGVWFGRALELNPNNLAAQVNVLYNRQYQQGDKTRLAPGFFQRQFPDSLPRLSDWPQVLNDDGPVDEPTFLFRTARALLRGGNPRQAAREFARCAELAPDWPVPKLWLGRTWLDLQQFTRALEVTDLIQTSSPPATGAGFGDLLYCRATALRGLGRTNEAAACIETFVRDHHNQSAVLSTAAALYAQDQQWERELALLDELLAREPDNAPLLARKGLGELRLAKYEAATSTLSRALSLAPKEGQPRLQRATAYLGAGQLDAAGDDYNELLKMDGWSQQALFGLAGIAWRKHDANAAAGFYQRYLSNAVPGSVQAALALERLKSLSP